MITTTNVSAGPGEGHQAHKFAQSPKVAKRERDRQEAESRGISVTQLLEARRAEVARNLRLHARATELGMTVKELRKRGLDIG